MRHARRATFALALLVLVIAGLAPPAIAVAPTGTVSLTSPASGETVTGNPVLRWAALAGAAKYRVQVSVSASFTTLLYNVDTAGLGATPTADLPLGTIHWRVAATDGSSGVGPFTAASFTRAAATQPELLSPVDGGTLNYPATTPVLRWSAVPGVKNYRVELDDSPDFTAPTVTTTANTALALSAPLILAKEYSWRVQGVSATAGVTTEYSQTWHFTTSWPSQAGRPVLTSPIGGVSEDVTDVVFRWEPVPGARNYQIQVNSNEAFTNNMTDDQVVMGIQYSPAQTYNNATYYWRVRSQDTGTPTPHYGDWSVVASFKRSWLPQPVLVAPRDTAMHPSQRFEWTPIARATYYELSLSTDPNFTTATVCASYGTTLTATTKQTLSQPLSGAPTIGTCGLSLSPGARYYWRVRGIDKPAGVNGVWSDPTDFYYLPSSSPALLEPADGASVAAPVLKWTPLAGYGRYRVTVLKPTGTLVTVDTYSTSYAPTSKLVPGTTYEWYVTGLSADNKVGIVAGSRTFTALAPDGAGSADPLVATSAQAVDMPSMTWQPVSGASYYNIYTGPKDTNLFDATPLNGSTKVYQAAYTHAASAFAPGDYDWYVRAYSDTGVTLHTSPYGTFTVAQFGFASYLSPPNCVLPDCVAERPNTPELSWQRVAGASYYEVRVALDKDFTYEVYTYTTNEDTLTPLESYLDNAAGQSYFWYVRPCKNTSRCGEFGGSSLLAHEQAFRKRSAAAVLVSPTDGATVSDAVSFEWEEYRTSAPDGVGARQYTIQIATDAGFQDVIDTATVDQTSYQAWESAYPDGVYYWRVQPLDGEQAGLTRSIARQFTKASAVPVPAAADPDAVGLPTMQWAAMPYASGYGVEVFSGTSSAFPSGSKVLSATVKLPAYAPTTTLTAGWYSWRVRKIDPDGNVGPWSAGAPTFQVRQPAPQLVLPAAAASLVSDDLLFTWEPVAGAASFRFESSISNGFGTTLEKVTTVMTTWAPAAVYVNGTQYFWRVSVLDGAGNIMATSVTRTFTKDSGRPNLGTATPTTKLAVNGTITVTFSEPVIGVSASSLTLVPASGGTTPVPTVLTPAPDVASATATITPAAPLIPGQYYDVTAGVGITDVAGNPVLPGAKRVRAVQTIDNTSPALAERWDNDGNSKASGGGYFASRQAGSTATLSVTGAGSLTVLGRASAAGGYADVIVDGVKKATANFYSKTEVHRKTMYTATLVGAGAHTVTIKVLGTKQSGSTGAYVDVDAFVHAGVTYQESSTAVRTTFARQSSASALNGSYDVFSHEPDPSGAEYRFSFRGTGLTWQATKMPNAGGAKVYVDGLLRYTTSLYSKTTAYKATAYNSAPFTDGVHSVRIVVTGAVPAGSAGAAVTFDNVTTR